MAKARSVEVGDWSESGTFLRKPSNGWLHDDRDLMNAGITYKIHYLGCIEVKNSMRTLQYQTRIQVTKEAILRLAEIAGRIAPNKKRKLPKQLLKLLGEVDTHWVGEVNLSISVDSLRICAKSNREIMNHSLPSISFASGGDEVTANFIGYVAKDPIHERACHVFECEDSQVVLTTIGQAFELRYKMYLQTPQNSGPQTGGSSPHNGGSGPHNGGSVHSVKNVLPTNEPPRIAPPIAPPHRGTEQGALKPLPSPATKPRAYSNLPGFPPATNDAALKNGQTAVPVKQLNIYTSTELTETGDYSNPGEITDTHQPDDYARDTTFRTVRQMGPRDDDDIDLTPAGVDLTPPDDCEPPGERLAIYANTLELGTPAEGLAIYGNTLGGTGGPPPSYEDPDRFASPPAWDGIYDDPTVTMDTVPVPPSARPLPQKLSDPEGNRPVPRPRGAKVEPSPNSVRVPSPTVIKKVPSPVAAKKVPSPIAIPDPTVTKGSGPHFDDTIYAKRVDGPAAMSSGGSGQQLKKMKYFHGTVSRVEAEGMLERDGDFLVRESGKQPGQYVLTGMGGGKAQHLLLIDKQGKVKSRDREFENIPHLVDHFVTLKTPLIIGDSEVYLKRPIVNSFMNT